MVCLESQGYNTFLVIDIPLFQKILSLLKIWMSICKFTWQQKNSPQWPNRECEVIGARTKRSLRCSFGYTGGGVDEAVDAVTLLMCFRLAHPLLLSLYHQRGLWSYLAHQNYTSFVREGNLNQWLGDDWFIIMTYIYSHMLGGSCAI